MNALVLDASATLGFLLHDEQTLPSVKALAAIEQGAPTHVPTHWWLEIANALLMAERRHRISQSAVTDSLQALQNLPVITDNETAQHSGGQTLSLARQYKLACYDAAYLELAIRRKARLVTTDRALAKAATDVGLRLLD